MPKINDYPLATPSLGDKLLGSDASEGGKTKNYLVSAILASVTTVGWESVTDKPALFPPDAHQHAWGDLTGTPDTLAVYGITDAYTKSEADFRYMPAGVLVDAYTKSESDLRYLPLAGGILTAGVGIRAALAGNAAGLHVSWIAGDTLPTLVVGSASVINNQRALHADSGTNTAVTAISVSGIGAYIQSNSNTPLYVLRNNQSSLVAAFNASATATTTVASILRLSHKTSVGAAVGFGAALDFYLSSSIGNSELIAGQIAGLWTIATDATRSSALTFSTVQAGGALTEYMRVSASGVIIPTNAALTFGTAISPTAQIVVASAMLRLYAPSGSGIAFYGDGAEKMRMVATGQLLLRTTDATLANGLHVPWVTGDTLPTLVAGSATSTNNQVGVRAMSGTTFGIYAGSTNGIGGYISSSSTTALQVYGSGSGSGILIESVNGVSVDSVPNPSVVSGVTIVQRTRLRTSGGTVLATFGSRVLTQLKSSTTNDQDASAIDTIWIDATHATRTSALVFSAVNAGGALTEMLRITATGTGIPMITSPSTIYIAPGNQSVTLRGLINNDSGFLRLRGTSGSGVRVETMNATTVNMIVLGVAAQTANLQEWQSSTAAVKSSVDSSGNWLIGPSITVGGATGNSGSLYFFNSSVSIVRTGNSGLQITTTGSAAGGGTTIANGRADAVPLTVKGYTAQSANLQEWQSISSVVQAAVDTNAGVSQTGLLLLFNGTLRRVEVGADDSGGVGYKMLRVLN